MKILKFVLIALSFTGAIVVVYKILMKNVDSTPIAPTLSTPTPTPLPSMVPSPTNNSTEENKAPITVSPTSTIIPMPSVVPTPIPTGKVNRVRREIEGDDD